ncbi:MAG: YciI family protein [Flavisolibacter sp.]
MRPQLLLLSLLFSSYVFAQNAQSVYDSSLAKKLGADDYGMKQYVMVFLKAGPVTITDTAQRAQILRGHLANIFRLSGEGKLLIAGPFLDKGNFAGVFIFDVRTIDEAKLLVATDPAIKAGMFEAEYHSWYGSAALMKINELHKQVQRKGFFD